jgi:predicted permease
VRRREVEERLDDELEAFLEMSAADKVREGLTAGDARRTAVLELGGIEQVKERVRAGRHGGRLDEIARDLRYAARIFVRNPGFAGTIVLTLALGIGANTAIFSLIDALMLRQLPVRSPHDLVQIRLQARESDGPGGDSFSYAIVRALADRKEIFSGLAGFSGLRFEVGAAGSLSRISGAVVTGDYYETLGLAPVAGRLLTRTDDEPGAPLAVVISYGYWERQYARSTGAVGQAIRIGGVAVTIVGVSPRGFVGANVGSVADLTIAVAALPHVSPGMAPLLGPGNYWLRALARPRAGVTTTEAATRMNAVWPRMAESVIASHWPAARRRVMAESVFTLSPGGTGWTNLREVYQKPLLVLMAVVGLVLLVACANVASLLLARASARQREIAVRLAIGAGRGRIVRQLLTESTLLSVIGAACGVVLAWVSGRFLVGMISDGSSPIVLDLAPNGHVLVFTTVVGVATGMLFGVAPALQTTSVAPAPVLTAGIRSTSARSRLLPSLVSAQVALSMVLLLGAGLFVRTLQNLRHLDPGFKTAGVLLTDLDGQPTPRASDFLEGVRGLPGVLSASLTTHTPLSGSVWSEPAVPSGQPLPERDNAYFVAAGPRFFETMQIPVLSGREFTDGDSAHAPEVAVINQVFAERYFARQSPIGQTLIASVRGQRRTLEIVGLVRNTNAAGLRDAPPATVYVAYAQLGGDFSTTIAVRVSGDLGLVSSAIRQALQPRFPHTPIEVRPFAAQVDATMVQERMMATLAAGFGLLALMLACVGLYGLLAYSVAQRTREIGIRMALGAQRRRVVAQVMSGGTRLVIIGILLGLPAAGVASRWVESLLFGLTPTDPMTLGGATVLLVIAALLATYLPARRASCVDPLTALRQD